MSERIIKGELREILKFENVIVGDSIQVGALEEFGDDAERAVLAIQAGVGIVLASSKNVTQGEVICDAIMKNFDENSTTYSMQRTGKVRRLINPGGSY